LVAEIGIGLDHNETRSLHGWHRHAAPKNEAALKAQHRQLICWSMPEIRRMATRLARRQVQPA
jgi:SRSO17 transposase